MKIHYLEIVSHDVDAVCKAYEIAHSVSFSEPDEFLGGARTCVLPDNSIIGIRGPLRDTEEPVVRPYWLVDNNRASRIEYRGRGSKNSHATNGNSWEREICNLYSWV